MIRSMTAYARAERSDNQGRVICELRSVNHRYLEPSFRMPDTLRFLEPTLRERVRARVKRGKMDCTLRFERPNDAGAGVELDTTALEALAGSLHQVAARLDTPAPVSPLDVLQWPGIVREPELDNATLTTQVQAAFETALDDLIAHRQREGARIGAVLEERLAAIEAAVDAVKAGAPEIVNRLRTRLRQRAGDLAVELEPHRLEQEVALLAQKADVAEELDRLRVHVAEMRDTLASDEAVGRRLDFIAQELNREANTLSAKATESAVTRHAVDLKVSIEQLREQIQNVE